MKAPSLQTVFSAWWPLAASWLFMGTELPIVSAVMARLVDPTISLAAYGGVVFPLALLIEAPVIMLLSASTALSKDRASYDKLFKFMMWAGAATTLIHAALVFTPLFDLVVARWMHVPAEIVEPSRIGLAIMLPWSWSIAYRRFQQGVLIRFGHSKAVGIGTALRLLANTLVLAAGWRIGGLAGIVVGTAGIAAGVVAEAIYAGLRVRPVLKKELAAAPVMSPPLRWTSFYAFYVPLAATSFINLVIQPVGSAALSRMPLPLESLAAWPVLGGFIFMWRSLGFAYNEVVVAQLDDPAMVAPLRRFALVLALAATAGLTLFALTPAAQFWFDTVSGIEPFLVALCIAGLWLSLLWPAIAIAQNFYQGVLVHARKTIHITISMGVFVAAALAVFAAGSLLGSFTGLFVGLIGFQAGNAAQALYLGWIARPVLARMAGQAAPAGTLARVDE